eukprot:435777-Pyramimonas_sp.AAC.1
MKLALPTSPPARRNYSSFAASLFGKLYESLSIFVSGKLHELLLPRLFCELSPSAPELLSSFAAPSLRKRYESSSTQRPN